MNKISVLTFNDIVLLLQVSITATASLHLSSC